MTRLDSDNDDMMGSNPSLRFMYDMDDDVLLSPTSSLHDSSANMITKGAGDHYWTPKPHHSIMSSPPLSPTGDEVHDERAEKRKSMRHSLSHVLTSPVRMAKGKISLSPRKGTRSRIGNKNGNKEWRKQLDLPSGVNQDQAIAFLLAKELKMLDF
jgi:hypothetical protein